MASAASVRGGGTKDFYGNEPRGEILDTRGYAGIVSYEPTELVITARGGTPLADVEKALADAGQCLPFEPPHFGAGATFGGCIAAGLSGPRRSAAGALRDFVLGVRIFSRAWSFCCIFSSWPRLAKSYSPIFIRMCFAIKGKACSKSLNFSCSMCR